MSLHILSLFHQPYQDQLATSAEKHGHSLYAAASMSDIMRLLNEGHIDVIISEAFLEQYDVFSVLRSVNSQAADPKVQIVVVQLNQSQTAQNVSEPVGKA